MIAVLFAREDSIYKTFPDCDVWDGSRNALLYRGREPIVAHPPCRLWGRLRTFSTAHPSEKVTAYFAVGRVRQNGGILEHPQGSTLWKVLGLPQPGERPDKFGGYTIWISQGRFGHKADKPTWLYIVGCAPENLPAIPFKLGDATHVIQSRKRHNHRPHVSKAEREHTPVELAQWMVEVARRSGNKNAGQVLAG